MKRLFLNIKASLSILLFLVFLSILIFTSCKENSDDAKSEEEINYSETHTPVSTRPRLRINDDRIEFFKNSMNNGSPEWEEFSKEGKYNIKINNSKSFQITVSRDDNSVFFKTDLYTNLLSVSVEKR